jgi:septal ring factor EnvC (AmiA/AmiB activator)
MQSDLDKMIADEAAAKKTYDEMMGAKTKEVDTLTAGIEEKTVRVGDLGVEIVQEKEDLDDTQKSLADDEKFLADMEKNCATKKVEWAEIEKMRGLELVAIADTIKILNDDDALELFKKTLPGSSFIQEQVTAAQMRNQALALLQSARKRSRHSASRVPLELITMVLAGKNKMPDFTKVLKMIDELTANLLKEQEDDDTKKEYCLAELDKLEDKKKELDRTIADIETLIEETKEKIATTADEIKALTAGIVQLDKDVAEATETRKEENEDYKVLMANDAAAKEVIDFAKNRMNKFYNPTLYKAPPKRELTEEERLTMNMGGTLAPTAAPGGIAGTGVTVFTQIRMHRSEDDVAPPPPPAAVPAYQSKGAESGGVIAMMDGMIDDLTKEMDAADADEKEAQREYEQFMGDSADKRAADSKAITDKEAAKAQMESELAKAQDNHMGTVQELMAVMETTAGVHGECDWMLENFDARKAAREGEVESLKKATAVLSGADFSLVQRSSSRAMRGA